MTAKEIIINAMKIDRQAFESGCGHANDQFDILVEEVENYHKTEVKKLSKADVINSVCDECEGSGLWKENETDKEQVCPKCKG